MQESDIPRFSRGFRFRHDEVRQRWVILAPERVFFPDEIAVEVLKQIDGDTTLAAIIDALSEHFAAPREMIAADVLSMVDDLAGKNVLRS